MDIGVGLPSTVPGAVGTELIGFAQRAEELGFSTLAVLDRLVYDSYDSLVALAAAAAVTERITLASTILLAAYRPSVAELAKQLASIDRLSGGRLVLGVAAGGREDDFTATGVPYRRRGALLDGLLDDLVQVWSGGGQVPGIGPKPSGGRIPIWIGGHSEAALARAAKHGIGWISPGGSAAAYPDLVERATTAFAAAGRDDKPKMAAMTYVGLGEDNATRGAQYLRDYYSYIGPKAEFLAKSLISDEGRLRETIDNYAAAGCDELLLFPTTADPGQLDQLAKVAFA
ncbi:LLM class flavin-dependent oxidoreductase [Amycolatopsis alba]|uniref:LLM class flavin-dependent oxidoreductase n=1 Tax=Amycolatopsis alba DSM 44262 TaxID=1125972 RepID=A0A229S8V7_AMYAL|nr:LLM class flavin-dependent oxidoreductase [Amycolatopsis alba]OXM55181.1 LLM class flavin-dependent oxidoreductase [Amycolatopsis alba DSM 44262]